MAVCQGRPREDRATEAFARNGWKRRREIAEGELREAVSVPDRTQVAGMKILVFDDVFTDGFTMREIARILRLNGAQEVAGVVLARQPGEADVG